MGKNNYGSGLSTNRGGVILNISSVQGLMFWPAMPTYSAAKSGIITYTRSAGHELEFAQHGIRFICLCPGAVHTAMQVVKITHFLLPKYFEIKVLLCRVSFIRVVALLVCSFVYVKYVFKWYVKLVWPNSYGFFLMSSSDSKEISLMPLTSCKSLLLSFMMSNKTR